MHPPFVKSERETLFYSSSPARHAKDKLIIRETKREILQFFSETARKSGDLSGHNPLHFHRNKFLDPNPTKQSPINVNVRTYVPRARATKSSQEMHYELGRPFSGLTLPSRTPPRLSKRCRSKFTDLAINEEGAFERFASLSSPPTRVWLTGFPGAVWLFDSVGQKIRTEFAYRDEYVSHFPREHVPIELSE